jgi:hypothetical protein
MKINAQSIPNAAKAAIRLVKAALSGQDVKVSDDTYAERLSQCVTCPDYLPESAQCGICTCFVQVKARLTTETCPKGHWV